MFINSVPISCKDLVLTMPIDRPYRKNELYDEDSQIENYENTISYLEYNLKNLTNRIVELEQKNESLTDEIHDLYQKISDLI